MTKNGDLVNCFDKDGRLSTPLHFAAGYNRLNICKYLLEKHYDLIKFKTEMGWTPLHSAAYWNNYEIVSYLISMNANLNALTDGKQSALHLAASQRNCKETLIILLLNKFTNYYLKNESQEIACDVATRSCEYYRLFEITDENLNKINY